MTHSSPPTPAAAPDPLISPTGRGTRSVDEWLVHKFGGTSLASSECYRNVVDILLNVRQQQRRAQQSQRSAGVAVNHRLCVVVSAMGEIKPTSQVGALMAHFHRNNPHYKVEKADKVTNLLIKCTELAAHQDAQYKRIFEDLKRRHLAVVDDLINEEIINVYRARVEREEANCDGDGFYTTLNGHQAQSPKSPRGYHYSHSDHGASAQTDLSLSILHMKETLRSMLEKDCDDLSFILRACWLSRTYDLEHNWWFGYGELWSARLICTLINTVLLAMGHGPGRSDERAVWLDARDVVVLGRTRDPMPDFSVSQEKFDSWLRSSIEVSTAKIVVVTGYIASAANGMPTTLGRDGSDYSASIFAALLKANHAVIWTDVDGVYSANPAQVKDAVLLDELSYDEASELAYFGAKVLHPKTMVPVIALEIPIWIKNTFNHSAPGSCILSARLIQEREKARLSSPVAAAKRPGVAYGVKGFSEISNLCLIEVKGTGVIGVPGIASRLFSKLKDANCSVILVTQAGSELSMCIAVPMSQADIGIEVVKREFRDELVTKEVLSVEKVGPCACLAVVGDGMRHKRGVAGRVFGALADAGVNVMAIAQGSSERNISAIIEQSEVHRALLAVHTAFLNPEGKDSEYTPLLRQSSSSNELSDQPAVPMTKKPSMNKIPLIDAEAGDSSSDDSINDSGETGRTMFNELATNENREVSKLRNKYRLFTRAITLKIAVVQGGWPLCEFEKLISKLKETWGERKEVKVEIVLYVDIRTQTMRRETADGGARSNALDWNELLAEVRTWRSSDSSTLPVIVDCTDSELVTHQYRPWLKSGFRLVTQRQLQSSLASLQSLPLFATLYDLQFRKDRVQRVEAILPTPLSYAFTAPASNARITRGQIVDSHRIARHAMIAIGVNVGVEVDDASIASDYAFVDIDRDDLIEDAINDHRTKAADQGMTYAFVASFDSRAPRIEIGLRLCPPSHPFAWLRGQSSCIMIYTERHGADAIILQGPAPVSEESSATAALTPLDNALTQFKAIVSDLAK